jgi:hypothetical protein
MKFQFMLLKQSARSWLTPAPITQMQEARQVRALPATQVQAEKPTVAVSNKR